MFIGASYYSECWPVAQYAQDARQMAEAGFNVVRVGEFAWSRFQPQPDRYEFGWMDECIGQMKAHGIRTLLGTPTRVAPPWLVERDRSMLIVNVDGSRAAYGGRYEFCLNHPIFREEAAALVQAIAGHYRDEEGIFAWHLDNEYGVGICYCERCAVAFQSWLQQRYGSLDELNRCWGSVYWSTEYTKWEQIDTPRDTENRQNPAVYLDYRRFFSDVTIGFARMATDAIRATGDTRPIVTNLHSSFEPHNLDYFTLNDFLDVAATNNNFPQSDSGQMNLDLSHGLKRRSFWSVEQRVSGGGVPVMTPISRPGDVRRWTYLTIGHGADAVIYWAWRRYLLGQEQYWGGILEHDGELGRFYTEARETAAELAQLAPALQDTAVLPDVGILISYDARWALDVELNHPELSFEKLAHSFWKAFRRRALNCEFSRPDADLSRYRLVVAPTLLLINPRIVRNLRQYVENGGILVLTVRCGVKDWNNKIATGDLLAAWRELTGVRVAEFTPLAFLKDSRIGRILGNYEKVELATTAEAKPVQTVTTAAGFLRAETYPVHTWMEILEPRGDVEILASYGQDYCAGAAAIVRHRIGTGQVFTLGTLLESEGQAHLVDWLLDEAGVQPAMHTPEDVEVLIREGADGKIYFLLNHGTTQCEVVLPTPMQDLLTQEPAGPSLQIPARGVRVLRQQA